MRAYTRIMARECYCAVLRTAARKVTSMYDAALEPVGLNLAQYSLLRNIAAASPLSLTELGRRVELDRSTIGRNVRLLQRRDFVQATPGADQRETTLDLTDTGRQALQRARPLWDEAQGRIETSLGRDRALALRTLLQSFE